MVPLPIVVYFVLNLFHIFWNYSFRNTACGLEIPDTSDIKWLGEEKLWTCYYLHIILPPQPAARGIAYSVSRMEQRDFEILILYRLCMVSVAVRGYGNVDCADRIFPFVRSKGLYIYSCRGCLSFTFWFQLRAALASPREREYLYPPSVELKGSQETGSIHLM